MSSGGTAPADDVVSAPPGKAPVIEIRDVEHWFHDSRTGTPVHAIAKADLVVRAGEFV